MKNMNNEKVKSFIILIIFIAIFMLICRIWYRRDVKGYNYCISQGYSEISCME